MTSRNTSPLRRPHLALRGAAALTALSFAAAIPAAYAVNTSGEKNTSQEATVVGPQKWFEVADATTTEVRDILTESNVAIEGVTGGTALVVGDDASIAELRDRGLTVTPAPSPADAANERVAEIERAREAAGESSVAAGDFPAGDEAYHTYDEVNAFLRETEKKYPGLAQVFTVGKSSEGRDIYGIKISDNVSQDEEGEAEVLQTCNVHAREHLTTEMCLYMVKDFTENYTSDERIKNIVDGRVLWFIPMQNPDGSMYDISGGRYQSWRKTRARNKDGSYGIDGNRNWAYNWGCCNGSSGRPGAYDYRGEQAESAPEIKTVADFVRSRNVGGEQRIKTHIDWHTYSELILWPFGYTYDNTAPGLDEDQRRVFKTLGESMARTNDYTPQQISDLYVADGSATDWFWGDQGIWSYTFEMYPRQGNRHGFYPPASLIPRETERNREAVLQFLEASDCMWKVIGEEKRCDSDWTPSPTTTSSPTTAPTTAPTTVPTSNPTNTWPWPWPWPTPTSTPTATGTPTATTTPTSTPTRPIPTWPTPTWTWPWQ